MKAILIEWDQNTGKRAGNVDPRDKNMFCRGWQNMDVTPAVELREILDGRDTSQYDGVKGITVLEGSDAINDAIELNFPSKFVIDDEVIYTAHLQKKAAKLNFDKLSDDRSERLKELKETHKIKGISEKKAARV